MRKVFISHSKRDASIASRIASELHDLGVRTFDPAADIRPGESWSTAVRNAIMDADVLIVIVGSPEAASGSWIGYEVGMAHAIGKPIVVLASDRYPREELSADIATQQVLQLDLAAPNTAARAITARLPAAA